MEEELATFIDQYKGSSNEELIKIIASLKMEVFQLKSMLFGSKRERRLHISPGQGRLFDEAEELAVKKVDEAAEKEDDEEIEIKSYKRKKKGRKPLSDKIPRVIETFDLNEEEKRCDIHGTELVKIGEKVTEKLEMIPAKLLVRREVRPTYKCPCCDKEDKPSFKSQKEEAPLFPKSFATPSLLASILTQKYADGLPLYRQQRIFQRLGVTLDRTTMARWVIQFAEIAIPLNNLMHEDLLESKNAHCDETTVQVLDEPKKRPQSKSYMWCMARQGEKPIILFKYFPHRNSSAAKELLDGFKGTLTTDAYKVYSAVAAIIGFVLAGCMAHVRRKFHNAEKSFKKAVPKGTCRATVALNYIEKLYEIEKKIKDKPPDEKLKVRQEKSKPIFDELHEWLLAMEPIILPSSPTGKAISYALNQWEHLGVFLENGEVSIDNNFLESHLRPFVVGRKAWLFSKSQKGADASAIIYSLVETAKANGIEPFDYLHLIIKELPKATCLEDYQKLLPYNVAQYYELNTFPKSL